MNKTDKIFIAGHRGLVGSAILKKLKSSGYENLIVKTHAELDLMDQTKTRQFFNEQKPDVVILAAAKVGGIYANNTYPADFIYQNIQIQQSVIGSSFEFGVKKLLFLGSSCIYPKESPQPIKEEYLLTGPLEATNRPYALAKIAGIELCWSLNRQHGTQYIAVMPTNLYGTNDNFDLMSSHVIPAMIRKFHDAKVKGEKVVKIWGTGKPFREFLHADDMADACVYLLELSNQDMQSHVGQNSPPLFNIGSGEEISIAELANLVRSIVYPDVALEFDTSMPDGTLRKLLDSSLVNKMGWRSKIKLTDGLKNVYSWYCEKHAQ